MSDNGGGAGGLPEDGHLEEEFIEVGVGEEKSEKKTREPQTLSGFPPNDTIFCRIQ